MLPYFNRWNASVADVNLQLNLFLTVRIKMVCLKTMQDVLLLKVL